MEISFAGLGVDDMRGMGGVLGVISKFFFSFLPIKNAVSRKLNSR